MSTPLEFSAEKQPQEDATTTIEIEDRAGNPYDPPVSMTIVDIYSEAVRKEEAKLDRETLRSRRRRPSDTMVLERRVRLAAAAIVSWDGVVTGDRQPVPMTRENAITLLRDHPWIRQQVEEASNDPSGFSESSSTT